MPLLKFAFQPFEVPPDLYRWAAPNGHIVKAHDRDGWLLEIEKFAKDNNIELPEGWQADAEDRLCRVLPPGWCKYEDGGTPQTYLEARFQVGDLAHGTNALIEIVSTPDALVDQEEAERRARICASCPANVAINGCYSCYAIADMIMKVKGARKTAADAALKGCAVCRCSTRAMVWVKGELLESITTEAQKEQYRLVEGWCWKAALLNRQQA